MAVVSFYMYIILDRVALYFKFLIYIAIHQNTVSPKTNYLSIMFWVSQTPVECYSISELTTDTPYLSLTDELWGAFCELFVQELPRHTENPSNHLFYNSQVKSSQKIFIAMQTKLLHNNCPIISTDKCRYIWIWHVTRKQINTTKGMWPSDQLPRLDTPFHRKTPVTHLEIQ